MPDFVRVAKLSDVPAGSGRELEHQGRLVALFNVDGQIFALDGTCPHAGGPLGDGELDGTTVTCPWHGWQFDVTTGEHRRNPACVQQRYEVKIEGDDILLAMP
jgi:nitrite reductase/ring-hydroxylating ferredoxin subunit